MTPAELKSAMKALDLTDEGLVNLVRVKSSRTVRYWKTGEREIPGPVVVILDALIDSAAVRRHFGLTLNCVDRL